MTRTAPRPPLFPYTTLFRSGTEFGTATSARVFGAARVMREKPDSGDGAVTLASLLRVRTSDASDRTVRSEEHTSELQSHVNFVCRLLLGQKTRRPPSGSPSL